jgi:hypothetical protein
MTILWRVGDAKTSIFSDFYCLPNELVLTGATPVFSAHVRLGEGHPSHLPGFVGCSVQVDAKEGQGTLVGGVHDVGAKNMALAGKDLDFAGEVSEFAEAD